MKYTEEDIQKAKTVSLTELARKMGFTPVKIGRCYSLKEIDSVRIYNDHTYYRWSNNKGGTSIDFLMEFGGVTRFTEAMKILLGMQGITSPCIQETVEKKKKFVLPEKNQNCRRAFAYLMKTRGISYEVLIYFLEKKLFYESAEHHNIIFVGKNPEGEVKYAAMRGTADQYHKFKCDVEGNDKNYGVNIVNLKSNMLTVCESCIDTMSYIDLTGDYDSNKLALSMVADNPLIQFLKDYTHIKKIRFCLDLDSAGKKNTALYMEKYGEAGYEVENFSKILIDQLNQKHGVQNWGKDMNAMLQMVRIKSQTTV